MIALELSRADHEPALLEFELVNRAYFARSIPDRGDAYFAEFPARYRALLDEQEAGICRFHLVVDEHGSILGRMNLLDLDGGEAELGYRIAESAAGRGVATAAVTEVCRIAASAYGLDALTARTTVTNPASMAVLRKTGFVVVGELVLNGHDGHRHRRDLRV